MERYNTAIENWATLSGTTTLPGQLLSFMNELGKIANSLAKLAGLL